MPVLESVDMFCAYLEKNRAAAESLYAASKWFAKKHKSYSIGKDLSVDKTSVTVMNNMLAKTQETPFEHLEDMRRKRKAAIDDFCHIYGGYIAFKLKKKADDKGYEIPEHIEDEYIIRATTLALNYISKQLDRNGYSEGTFSHLVHKTIKIKAKNMFEKYNTFLNNPEKNAHFISITEDTEPILGGILEIENDNNGAETGDFEFDRDQFDVTSILCILKDVKTKHSTDDYEMFCLRYIKGWKLEDIAKEFNLTIGTIHNRLNDFAKAALTQHEEKLKEMRENF